MRDIRFRRFSKDGGKYYDTYVNIYHVKQNESFHILNDDVIEQFTGLSDYDGNEVFEGDILKIVGSPEDGGVVEYAEDYGMWECGRTPLIQIIDDSVVVGNINENPELL